MCITKLESGVVSYCMYNIYLLFNYTVICNYICNTITYRKDVNKTCLQFETAASISLCLVIFWENISFFFEVRTNIIVTFIIKL